MLSSLPKSSINWQPFPELLDVKIALLRCNHRRLSSLLLLLILHQLHVILGHLLILFTKPLQNILAQISLHGDDLAHTSGQFRGRTSSRKLLTHLFCNLLDVKTKGFEAGHFGDVFALVALDALDDDFGRGEFFGAAGFGGGGFCFFLFCVLFGAFLGVDREGGEVGCYGVWFRGGPRVSWVQGRRDRVRGGEAVRERRGSVPSE